MIKVIEMKKIINLIIITASIITWQSCDNEKAESPITLEDKQAVLAEKKQQLKSLQEEIELLQDDIISLSPELQEKSKLVDTMIIANSDFKRYIEIQGSVIADDVVNVVSEIPGRINYLKVREGDPIRKGQVIATVDMESVELQIAEIQTALSLASDVYDRQKRLWDQNIGSEVQFLQAKNNKERLEKSLESAQFQLTKSKIYAPISGVVDREILKLGEIASPGMPIVSLINTRKVKVNTDLPERFLKIIRKGDRVNLYFPSIDLEMTGRVSLMGRSIDPTNRTLNVEITPAKYSELLKPNLLAEIKILEKQEDNVVTIPVEYVLQLVNGQEFVYLADIQDDRIRAKRQLVETGDASGNDIIITSGLEPGTTIVSKGSRNISEGDLLKFD